MLDLVANKKAYVNGENKIVPHPQLQGRFQFDATSGLAKVDDNQKIIWGFDDNIVSIDTVVSLVEEADRYKLLESVHKREMITQSPIMKLKNGNKIQEVFQKKFIGGENGDYEFGSLEGMNGITRLVA